MPGRKIKKNTVHEQINAQGSALNGDMIMLIVPATTNRAATTEAWTRYVDISIVDSTGNLHSWLTQDFTTTLSIADTSTAGTASIAGTTLSLIEGQATIVVDGDAAAWIATETNTLTVANITVNGYTVTGGTSVETIV